MFSIGEAIVYRNHGVCKIVSKKDIEVGEKVRTYYILKPVFEKDSVYYVPVGQKKVEERMHHVISVEEVHQLIQIMQDDEKCWIENDKERKRQYKQILEDYDRDSLAKYIKSLYLHQEELEEEGRKLYAADRQFKEEAEKVLYDEFAFVLEMTQDEIAPYIFKDS